MSNLRIRLRDWWRGYTDEDLLSVVKKLRAPLVEPNDVIELTDGEMTAVLSDPRVYRVTPARYKWKTMGYRFRNGRWEYFEE